MTDGDPPSIQAQVLNAINGWWDEYQLLNKSMAEKLIKRYEYIPE